MNFLQFVFQWITLVRKHAEVVVNDAIIFPVFKKLCKVWNESFNFK